MAEELEVGVLLSAEDNVSPALAQAAKSAQNFVSEMNKSSKALVTLGSMVGAAGFAMYRFGKQSFGAAARVSELKVSIDAIGKATGIGAKAINEAASNIAKQGIEMAAAQGIAIEYAQANLNLADAAKVARVAQDLAVISQRNSTDTAQLLTRAVRTGNSQLLKSAGISRMASEGYAMYAKEIGKTATTLTAAERQQAMINLILDEGKRVAGVYEASMTEAGKVLRSFPRLMNDMQVATGTALLQGLGPLIKSAYDLTNAFSKTVKEGGALNPVLTELGIAMKMVFQPIADGLKKLADFFTLMNRGKIEVQGVGQRMAELFPLVAAVSTALSGIAGKQILNAFAPLRQLSSFIKPLGLGLVVLVATTPRLRDAFLQVAGAALQLVGPLVEIAAVIGEAMANAIDTVAPLAEGLAVILAGAFKVVGPALQLVADLLVFLQKPIEFLIILWGVKWVASQMLAAKAALTAQIQLAALGTQTTLTGRAATGAVRAYTNFAFGLQTTGSVAKAFGGTMVAVGNTIKATMVSVMTTMLPMLAITAAIWAGMAIFNKIREADKAREAAVKGVTDALKQQIDALKATNAALAEYLGNVENLQNALINDSDASKEFIRVMHLQGVATKDALAELIAYKTDRVAYIAAQYDGITATYAEADALARYTLAAQGGAEMTAEAAAIMPRLTSEQIAVANAYRTTTAALNAMDLGAALQEEREMLEIKSKEAALAYVAADAIVEEAIARGASISGLDKEILIRDLARKELEKYDNAQKEAGKVTRATAVTTGTMIDRLKALVVASADGKAKMEEMYDAMFGFGSIDLYKTQKQVYEVRRAVTDLGDKVKDTQGNFDSFTGVALELANQVATNAAEMRNLEMTEEEIAGATNVMIGTFVEAAKQAGFTQEQINGLLESLGMLNGYRSVAIIDADISRFKANLEAVLAGLEAVGGAMDAETAKRINAIKLAISALEREKVALAEAEDKYGDLVNATKKGSAATKEFTGRQKELRDEIVKTVTDAIDKETEKVQELKSKMDALKSGLKSTIVESASLGNAFEYAKRKADEFNQKIDEAEQAQRDYAQQVAQSVRQTLSLSDAFGESQASSQAVEAAWGNATAVANEYAMIQQELADNLERQAALEKSLYGEGSRYARADVVEALNQNREDAIGIIERLSEAEQNLGMAMDGVNKASAAQIGFLDALRKRVSDAKEFASVISQLGSMGLNKDALDQIVSAGAVAGTQMAKELLSGGQTAISETNTLFTELGNVAQQTGIDLGNKFYQVGDRVGLDFGSALMERAKMATEFAKKVEMLAAQGLSPENIIMLLNAGLEAGTAMADELIRGGQTAIDNANQIHKSLTKLAEDLGVKLSGQFFDAGIAMGEKIVEGLKQKLKEVENALKKAQTISQLEGLLGRTQSQVGPKTVPKPYFDPFPAVPAANVPGAEFRMFADGGIVTRPMLGMVGEAGPEAIIPLSQLGSGGDTYYITVEAGIGANGAQIGDEIVEALRKYERRNGSVPIKTL